jgi:Methionyl-tRNA synthetase
LEDFEISAVYWPAFLMAANITPPKRVYGHGWILSGEEKMSKSKGNILDPLEIINIYGLDSLRYYLLKEVSFGNDGSISEEKLENCINSDLANNFGNLCQRVLSFAEKNCSSFIPDHKFNNDDLIILNSITDIDKIRSFIDNQDINRYMGFIIDRLFASNKYFNDQEPWKKKDDKQRLNTIVYTAIELIRKITILLYPVMPQTTVKILNSFNIYEDELNLTSLQNNESLKKNDKINKLDILFKKIQ